MKRKEETKGIRDKNLSTNIGLGLHWFNLHVVSIWILTVTIEGMSRKKSA